MPIKKQETSRVVDAETQYPIEGTAVPFDGTKITIARVLPKPGRAMSIRAFLMPKAILNSSSRTKIM